MIAKYLRNIVTFVLLSLASVASHANTIGFADTIIEYFDSGNGSLVCPEGQGGVFPPGATTANCVPFSVVLGDDPGSTSDYLSLPTGSFVTVGFIDEVIIDGVGNDIFISEVGEQFENAEIYVSSLFSTNPDDFVLLGIADGNTISSFDLASIGFIGQVRSVKVLSLENGGYPTAPGFDLAHVAAVNFSIATVPVPTAIWLFASGLLGLISVARRK